MTAPRRGHRVHLVTPGPGELEPFLRMQSAEPRTPHGGLGEEGPPGHFLASDQPVGPLLVRGARSGEAYGFATGYRPAGSAEVDLSVFLDPRRSPPGVGPEAYLLYARRLAEDGVPAVRIIRLGGDDLARRMLERLGLRPQVRMREHVWSGGTLHDWLAYRLAAEEIDRVERRLDTLLRRPAVGSP